MNRVAELLEERKRETAELMTREMGKVLAETGGDTQEGIDTAYHTAGEGRLAPQPGGVGRTIEQREVRDRRAQVRILLEVPHQRLDVGHPAVGVQLTVPGHRGRRYRTPRGAALSGGSTCA